MIFLYQNDEEYNYDVRAISLAFFDRDKIIEVDREELLSYLAGETEVKEAEKYLSEHVMGLDGACGIIPCLFLDYQTDRIVAELCDREGKKVTDTLVCDYRDHEHHRNDVSRFLYRLWSSYTGKTLPWGTLTGIRPTKIVMKWMEETGDDPESIELCKKRFSETYLADAQKAELCCKVAAKEKQILEAHDYGSEYSLYIGIPFCPTTCLYCSFASFPVERFGDRMEAYLEALFQEMAYVAERKKDTPLTSVYVGGGTPTALNEQCLAKLMDRIHGLFPMDQVKEFTVEAGRPDSVNAEKMRILKEAGVDRISINPQTMHQETLDIIGRRHTVEEVISAFHMAREAGFDNINMDIITGLPGEGLPHIRTTLDEIFGLRPESLTVHSLAIKRAAHLNTEMEKYTGMVKGSTNEMLRLVDSYCLDMGMQPYYMYRQKNIPGNLENIGYTLPGKECLYNILIMEEKQDIIACGAGASTKYLFREENRIERTESVKNIDHYITRIDEMIDRKRKYMG